MNPNVWTQARLREPLMNLRAGDPVVVVESTFKHKDKTIGRTFWVMGYLSNHIYQVAECAFGKNAYMLLERGVAAPAKVQKVLHQRAMELLRDSAYAPKNRSRHMWPAGHQRHHMFHTNLETA